MVVLLLSETGGVSRAGCLRSESPTCEKSRLHIPGRQKFIAETNAIVQGNMRTRVRGKGRGRKEMRKHKKRAQEEERVKWRIRREKTQNINESMQSAEKKTTKKDIIKEGRGETKVKI
jgi:hypothetical protein